MYNIYRLDVLSFALGIVHGLFMFIQEYNEVVFSGLNEACLLLPALFRSAQKPTLPGKELFNIP